MPAPPPPPPPTPLSPEAKLRALASVDATMISYFGNASLGQVFRWYDTQHLQGSALPAVTVRRVSTVIPYGLTGRRGFTLPRFQIDLRCADSETGRTITSAIIAFLDTVNLVLSTTGGTVSARQAPTFVLNQRDGMDYRLNPPVWMQTLDVRLYNLEG